MGDRYLKQYGMPDGIRWRPSRELVREAVKFGCGTIALRGGRAASVAASIACGQTFDYFFPKDSLKGPRQSGIEPLPSRFKGFSQFSPEVQPQRGFFYGQQGRVPISQLPGPRDTQPSNPGQGGQHGGGQGGQPSSGPSPQKPGREPPRQGPGSVEPTQPGGPGFPELKPKAPKRSDPSPSILGGSGSFAPSGGENPLAFIPNPWAAIDSLFKPSAIEAQKSSDQKIFHPFWRQVSRRENESERRAMIFKPKKVEGFFKANPEWANLRREILDDPRSRQLIAKLTKTDNVNRIGSGHQERFYNQFLVNAQFHGFSPQEAKEMFKQFVGG